MAEWNTTIVINLIFMQEQLIIDRAHTLFATNNEIKYVYPIHFIIINM